jgi:hypothetical protein
MRPPGLKPKLTLGALHGAEAPFFHGTAAAGWWFVSKLPIYVGLRLLGWVGVEVLGYVDASKLAKARLLLRVREGDRAGQFPLRRSVEIL